VFARSFCDEVRVLKIRMGSNRAGCFLEAVVLVEGKRKGVIRLPEGRRGWGWQRFVEELCPLTLDAKVLPEVGQASVDGSPPSYAKVLAVPVGGMKSFCTEALASDLGRWLPKGGGAYLTEVLRGLALEFLMKMRAEVDRVIFFRLGLKTEASRGIRKRLGQVLSWLGLKPKLILGRHRLKQKACRLILRPRPLEAESRVELKVDDARAPKSVSGQGESFSEKMTITPIVCPVKSLSVSKLSSEKSYSGEVLSFSVEVVLEMDPDLEQAPSMVATRNPFSKTLGKSSPVKMLGKCVDSPLAKHSSLSVEEAELAMGIPTDEILVLPASSSTNSVSLPSLVSSPISPASQPSSLAFAGSSDEPRSLPVTQTPSPEPSGLVDFNEGFESVSAPKLPIPESAFG
jgi:hypothetical protein